MKSSLLAMFLAAPLLAQEVAVSPAVLGAAAGRRSDPRIAGNGNGFVAAWSDHRFGDDVYGARFDAAGQLLAHDIPFAPGYAFGAIASDGRDYLAAVADSTCSGINVVHIGGDGTFSAPRHVSNSVCPSHPEIASNGSSYMAVYGDPVRFVLLDGDGNVLRGPAPLDPLTKAVAVASDGRNYLVAGFRPAQGLNDVVTIAVSGGGNAGTAHVLMSSTYQTNVALASDGAKYLLFTTGTPNTSQLLGGDGTPAGPLNNPQSPQTFGARVSWNGSDYLASWTTFHPPFTTTLNVGRIAADGAPHGAPATTSADSPARAPSDIASAGGTTMLVRVSGNEVYAAPVGGASTLPAGDLLSLSAPPQVAPQMAAIPGGAVVVWNEPDFFGYAHLKARLLDANGQPHGEVAAVGEPYILSYHVAFDGTNIVVGTLHRDVGILFGQRFTLALQPVDAQPVAIVKADLLDFALAGGGGAALFQWRGGTTDAALLPSASVLPMPLAIAWDSDPGVPAATWDGSEFVVVYGRQGDAVAKRIGADGRQLDAMPQSIAGMGGFVARLAAASNGRSIFAAWSGFGAATKVFGAAVTIGGAPSAPVVLSPPGVVEGPFVAMSGDAYDVAWTVKDAGVARLQWRTFGSDAIATLPPSPRFDALSPAIIGIGPALFAAYPKFDASAGGVSRIYVAKAPPPRRRAAF